MPDPIENDLNKEKNLPFYPSNKFEYLLSSKKIIVRSSAAYIHSHIVWQIEGHVTPQIEVSDLNKYVVYPMDWGNFALLGWDPEDFGASILSVSAEELSWIQKFIAASGNVYHIVAVPNWETWAWETNDRIKYKIYAQNKADEALQNALNYLKGPKEELSKTLTPD